MASPIKFVSSIGRVNNTPISKCIYCQDKTPNAGFPYCSDCFKLRGANERPCCSCKKTMIACTPYSKMKRIYCTSCTEEYKVKQQTKQVKVEIPLTKPCDSCEKVMVPYLPENKTYSVFCEECSNETEFYETEFYETTYETTYENTTKQHLLQMFEGLSHKEIVDIVYELLDKKEHIIQESLNEIDLLNHQLEELSK
jgi:hypothetical protein